MPATDRVAVPIPPAPSVTRRALLTGGAAGTGIGALLGAAAVGMSARVLDQGEHRSERDPDSYPSLGEAGDAPGFAGEALPCHGTQQPGVVAAAAHVRYLAYRLRSDADRDALSRLMRVLTEDIEGLTSGAGPLADPEPELAARPARLMITVGVGHEFVRRVNATALPEWLGPLPEFSRDELGSGYDGGDLLVQLQADDPLAVAHAARMLHRDVDRFATLLWVQQGFRSARGAEASGATMRNLMGQVDGTANPAPDEPGFDDLVWITREEGPEWLAGGSAFVLRRIRMELDTWDRVDRPGREQSIGRTLRDGAPLSDVYGGEHAEVDFTAKNALGLSVISSAAHIRRAHSSNPRERVLRRAVNYDDGHESGLLFGCYQRDPRTQFVPIQQRLDEEDLLNEWVTHVGSAVFAVLPGFTAGEVLGAALFAS